MTEKTATGRQYHRLDSLAWLRAAVLGANDGIVSTSSLILGVAASHATHHSILVTGIASLVAGTMSMATGEYVSVQSQADTEQAELARESIELHNNDNGEHQELAAIYVDRGVKPQLAKQVSEQLMKRDALGAHARDELGITDALRAKPLSAALASALSFALGAALPLLTLLISPPDHLIVTIAVASLFFLAMLGGLAAYTGGASVTRGVVRVTFWSALAMGVTMGIGTLLGVAA